MSILRRAIAKMPQSKNITDMVFLHFGGCSVAKHRLKTILGVSVLLLVDRLLERSVAGPSRGREN